MRVLIITSEPLDPDNVLPSTFELTQAQILSRHFSVAIVSVRAGVSFTRTAKALVRRMMGSKADGQVRKHSIEGVTVFEGIGYRFPGPHTPEAELKAWVAVGMRAVSAAERSMEGDGPLVVHAHGRFLYGGALALEAKKKYGYPYVYTDHSTFYQRGIAPVSLKPVLGQVIDGASRVTMVSRSLLGHVESYLGRRLPQAMILPNVLDLLFESPLPVRKDRGGEFVFVNVASLDHKKGLDILIRAFAKAFRGRSSVRLYLCGDGPLAGQLKALAAELGVGETVVFRGRLAKAEVVKILDGADFFVLPSRMETFGVVVIEALARGVPVIATRSGGPEYIVEESTGLLVEPEDEGQLVGALVGAYEGRLVVKSAAEIRATALRRYGSDEFLKNMIQLYNSVVQ